MNLGITAALILFLLGASDVLAAPKSLKGQVNEVAPVRIARPTLPGKASMDSIKTTRQGTLDTSSFDLSGASSHIPAAAESAAMSATLDQSSHALSAGAGQVQSNPATTTPSIQAGVDRNRPPVPPSNTGGNGGERGNGDGQREQASGQITFRFCYYDISDGVDATWEGLREALYLQSRGMDVALMLDRGGVRLANKHNPQEAQLVRGSTGRMINHQTMLRQFISKGGQVYVSERWARVFNLLDPSCRALTDGVITLDDDSMSELLISRTGRIVNY